MLASSDNKVIFVGHSGVGKTSIINKKQNDSFNIYQEATIGAAYTTMKISIDDETEVSFGLWDTAGQERYDALTPLYFRGCRVAVVVFDLSKKDSFERANYWMKKIEEKYKAQEKNEPEKRNVLMAQIIVDLEKKILKLNKKINNIEPKKVLKSKRNKH